MKVEGCGCYLCSIVLCLVGGRCCRLLVFVFNLWFYGVKE